ncbi:MAG TPA: hypothetical protein VIG32_07400 [Candidatus Baltobacteraceae bacterium]|jgi:hypothetical protein
MNKLHTALLATAFGLGSVASIGLHQAQNPTAGSAGLLSAGASIALADEGDNHGDHGDQQGDQGNHKDRGHHRGHRNNNNNCGYYGNNCNNNNYNRCGNNNGENEDNNRGRNNCNNNGGYYGNGRNGNQNGNQTVSGVIVGVSGNQVTIMQGLLHRITINDQPALDRQATGRIEIGRSITAYGYYSNGTFYATSIN